MSLDRIAVPDGLVLGQSRMRDVVSVLGEEYSLGVRHLYRKLCRFTMRYSLGASYHLSIPWNSARRSLSRALRPCDEARGILSSVSFFPPFPGKTAEGIGVHGDTLADVIARYGNPEMREGVSIVEFDQPGWSSLSASVYACYDGMEFHVPRLAGCHIRDIKPYLEQPVVTVTICEP